MIRPRHGVQTSNHLRIRLISFAYCKVGEGWIIIRFITETLNLLYNILPRSAGCWSRLTGRSAAPSRRAASNWGWSAAALMATRASPPARPWVPRPICWCATAARPCSAKPPEIYGAEHLLTRRAVSREVGERLVARIRWWGEYTARNGSQLNNNPTPATRPAGSPPFRKNPWGRPPRAAPRTWWKWSALPSLFRARDSCSWIRPASIRSP